MSRLQRGRTAAPAESAPSQPAFKRGAAAVNQAADEAKAAAERRNTPRQPWRYRADVGESNPVIILDDKLEELPFLYEHTIKGADGKFTQETCLKESGYCPLCNLVEGGSKTIKASTYVMFLTVLDLRGYVNKDKKEIPYTKRLMAAKGTSQTELLKILQKINDRVDSKGKKKGIRGVFMDMGRHADLDASCGTPQMIEDAKGNHVLYEIVPEAELEADYWNKVVKDKQSGRIIKPEGDDIEPFEYEKMFPLPDPDALAKKYGARAGAGGQEDINEGWEGDAAPRGRGRRSQQVADADEAPAPARGRRNRVQEEPAEEAADETAEDDAGAEVDADEAIETPAPRRRRGAAAAEEEPAAEADDEPAPRGRTGRTPSRRAAQAEEADDGEAEADDGADDAGEDDTPPAPARTRTRAAKAEAEPAPRGRAAAAKGRRAGRPI